MPNTKHPKFSAPAGFVEGLRAGLPFNLAIMPFGFMMGVVAAAAGLDIPQAMGFAVLVIAGASSLTAIELIAQHGPALLVVLTAGAVNARMAMYSASLAPHMIGTPLWARALAAYLMFDHNYALTIQRAEANAKQSPASHLSFFIGAGLVVVPGWVLMCFAGTWVGNALPDFIPIDYAGVVMFSALFAPMLRSIPHLVAALVAMLVSVLAVGLPYSLGILLGGLAGMLAGAVTDSLTDAWRARRKEYDLSKQ